MGRHEKVTPEPSPQAQDRREEEVVQEALRRVESRRRRRGEQEALRWIVAWWLAVLAAFFLAPWPLEVKVRAAVHGLCAQVESHMPCFAGKPLSTSPQELYPCGRALPLCSRDSALYLGTLLGTAYLVARKRWRAAGRPARWFWAVMVVAVALFCLDVLNSVAQDWYGSTLLYPPNNVLRLISGLLMGLVLSVPLLWAVNLSFADRRRDRPIFAQWVDLVGLLLVGAAGGTALWSGWPPMYVPATVLSVGSAISLLLAGNTLMILAMTRGKELLASTWEAAPSLWWGSIATVVEMAALSWLRYTLVR